MIPPEYIYICFFGVASFFFFSARGGVDVCVCVSAAMPCVRVSHSVASSVLSTFLFCWLLHDVLKCMLLIDRFNLIHRLILLDGWRTVVTRLADSFTITGRWLREYKHILVEKNANCCNYSGAEAGRKGPHLPVNRHYRLRTPAATIPRFISIVAFCHPK